MAKRVTAEQKKKWLSIINQIQYQMADIGFDTGSPLEEAYYHLDQAVEHIRDIYVSNIVTNRRVGRK